MASRPRGFNENEMFMGRPAPDECDSPTVEPLRIFKPASPQPASSSSRPSPAPEKPAERKKYPAPSYPKPSFPLPPGASSSAQPLPYPEDDDYRIGQPSSTKPSRLPYPDDGRRTSGSSGGGTPKPYTSPTPARVQTYNDTSPRLTTSPTDRRPGLAERRGAAPQPLSPVSPDNDKEDGLFAKPLHPPKPQPAPAVSASLGANYPSYAKKPYYPPPGGAAAPASSSNALPPPKSHDDEQDTLKMPVENTVNRFASTASNSTTRANRGSPPPPETPIVEPGNIPGGGIEARYAAAGISGTATLNSFQSAAATQRLAQYGNAPPQQVPRPWTPTESPDQQPHGPPTVYQGNDPITSPRQSTFNVPPRTTAPSSSSTSAPASTAPASTAPASTETPGGTNLQVSILEQDFQRMGTKTPPPAYSSVNPASGSAYPNEKARPAAASSASSSTPAPAANSRPATATSSSSAEKPQQHPAAALASPALQHAGHPAFANDPKPEDPQNGQPQPLSAVASTPSFQGPGPAGPASPPPLPEGWMAHLDQNSGQYYYIHIATQSTQWDFPKGPNPIHHEPAPLSPTASTYGNPLASPMYGKHSAASPMFPPATPGYAESIMSVASATPTAAGFSGPPPSAGVDMFKIAPANGVYFGPYLRYVNMDIEKGAWLGSIMVVTDVQTPPTIHIHLSADLSPNPRQLVPNAIYTHQRWTFFKYDVDLPMGEATERWTYAVTSHLGCTRYEFVVAGRQEMGWRFIAHSNNDFAPTTSQNDRAKLGGVGFMWKDILQKNVECGGFHVQLGLGDQIYGDRLWRDVPLLKQWLNISGKENRKNAQWTARHEEDVSHAYFHYYTSHFDQPFLREAFAQIPHILQIDDHDIFDGYGSFPEYMQSSQTFKNIGRIATEMYLLFQHHTTAEILRNVNSDLDLFTITGMGWHFVKYLGPAVVVVGPDCRSERTQKNVMAGPTYQGIFPKVAMLPPSVQHCIWMISVPLIYPRLETVEQLANSLATGKKAVNTTYNLLGKVTSSVAGVVGGKEVVQHGFSQVKKAVGKSGLMGNVLNQFGDIDIADTLKDMWTHESKDLERTYLIRTLQQISHDKGVRMTFFSGDVAAAGAGLVHDPAHPGDHKTMYQIVTSPIVAAPSSNYMLKMLHNNKPLYVPANGVKSSHEVSDTKEDMMEIFHTDASGGVRELKKLMGRRNYVACTVFDPATLPNGGLPGMQPMPQLQQGLTKLNLAVDFVVQGDGAFTGPTKYGPVIVEHLEYGR